jgi:hypothetical protein
MQGSVTIDRGSGQISTNAVLTLSVLVCVATFAMFVFSFNSGYGYDQLEYLVIGRGLTEGIPFYEYIPSKSPGIYYFVGVLLKMGVTFEHLPLSIVIATLYLLTITLTLMVMRRWFGLLVAFATTALTGVAAFFMELNFLEPTTFVYCFGLLAFDALLRFEQQRSQKWLFIAGIWIGLGIGFKSSGAFYGLAGTLQLVIDFARDQNPKKNLWKRMAAFGGGSLLPVAILGAYYFSYGKLNDFIEWTFVFPLFQYPSNISFLSKLYTKLLWVHLIIIACFIPLASGATRRVVLSYQPAVLSLLFGLCAYLALLKTQASHYAFPGAPFLLACAIFTLCTKLPLKNSTRGLALRTAMATVTGITIIASLYLYRPEAFERFAALKDYRQSEASIRNFIQCNVAVNRYVLITSADTATLTYWLGHRYPPPPLITSDVQTTWFLRNQPEEIYRIVDNEHLVLIEFKPNNSVNEGQGYPAGLGRRIALRFRRVPIVDTMGGIYWLSKKADEKNCSHD